jgi:uncharacterized protein
MFVDFLLMFTLGLVSSPHCAQMCGPIVLSYSVALGGLSDVPRPKRFRRLLWNHGAYNAGRIITYSTLGGIAGLVGGSVGMAASIHGAGSMLAVSAGIAMIVIGVAMFGFLPGSKFLTSGALQFSCRVLKPCSRFLQKPGSANRFLLGLGFGLIPCGLVYAGLMKAAATGSMLRGATCMFAFGLGTTASLLAVGLFSSLVRGTLTRWTPQLVAASVIFMGALLIWRGSAPAAFLAHSLHGHH